MSSRPGRPVEREGVGAPHAPLPPPGTRPDLWRLHLAVHRSRDDAARAALVAEYRPNAIALARRLHRDREPLEDLVQVALEGLLGAIDRFDPERGQGFLGFATPTITGTLKRHYRDRGWAMRVPRRVHELLPSVQHARASLLADLGRDPRVDEVADLLGVEVGAVLEALDAAAARMVGSIDVTDDQRRPEPGSPDGGFRQVEDQLDLHAALRRLDAQQRRVLTMYHEQELTQAAIGRALGCSQMHVCRILRRAHDELHAAMSPA